MKTVAYCCLFLLAISNSSAQRRPHVTGFFSDMQLIPEVGDVLGTEVWIVYARGGYWATVQMAEGAPDPPTVVPVEVSGSTVKFEVRQQLVDQDNKPAPDSVLKFKGTVTRSGLSGTMNDWPLKLKRTNSYWQ